MEGSSPPERSAYLERCESVRQVKRESEQITTQLVELLGDEHTGIRLDAAYLLARTPSREVHNALAARVVDPQESYLVKVECIRSLSRLDPSHSVETFESALGDPIPDVRAAAVRALVSAGTLDAMRAVARTLKDPDPAVRRLAKSMLAHYTTVLLEIAGVAN